MNESSEKNNSSLGQNRRQKVFNRGFCVSVGGHGFTRGGL